MTNRLFVDVHILQTVPPSCVNRDDTGSPKTAVYGGVTRARVSSQAWKKAVREMFRETFETFAREDVGVRTKQIVSLVAQEILAQGGSAESAEQLAQKALEAAGLKIKSVQAGTDALFFMSYAQAKALAALVLADPNLKPDKNKKEAQAALKGNPSLDIALFGRMVADDPNLNTDAACQVAHSISTHRAGNEFDFFTAVDDYAPADNAGAGHLGTVEYNSSTLYRYANVAVHELQTQLGTETPRAVVEFVRAFVLSMPTGKQKTFANRTVPYAVLVTLREDQPVNFAGAFEAPVKAGGDGYAAASAAKLVQEAQETYQSWLREPRLTLTTGAGLTALAAPVPFNALLEQLEAAL
jgi:CRISPR system Cascade subunit CasC